MKWLSLALALMLGVAIGFSGRRALRAPAPAPAPRQSEGLVLEAKPAVLEVDSRPASDPLSDRVLSAPLEGFGDLLLEHRDDAWTRRLLAVRWAQEDPVGFAAFLHTFKPMSSGGDHLRSSLESILYRVWARVNPEEAFQHALDHPWIENNDYWGLAPIINTSAEQDLDVALQLVKKAGKRLNGYSPGPWLDAPPQEVMPKIAQLPKCMWRGSAMDDIYEQWSQSQPREAITFFVRQEEVNPFHRTGVTLAKAVARNDPEGAMEWARSMKNPTLETMVRTALKGLPSETEG